MSKTWSISALVAAILAFGTSVAYGAQETATDEKRFRVNRIDQAPRIDAVSYTHLTLPTKA